MSAGWKLTHGELKTQCSSDDELYRLFNKFFSRVNVNLTSSYKFALIKSILDNLLNCEYSANKLNRVIINYDLLAYKFAECYWNIVAKYNLKQGRVSEDKEVKIEKFIKNILEKLGNNIRPQWDSLSEKYKLELVENVKRHCFNDVFGALYKNFDGKLFEFDRSKKYFALSLQAYKFMLRYNVMLENNNYCCFASFLETINDLENTYSILTKLRESIPERHSLQVYRDIFTKDYNYNHCFYCGNAIDSNVSRLYQIDHFIPWAFIKEDKIWNLVPACSKCNTKLKRMKLAPKEKIEILNDRNAELKKLISDLSNEDHKIQIKKDFVSYNDKIIQDLYTYASNSGYEILKAV